MDPEGTQESKVMKYYKYSPLLHFLNIFGPAH